MTMYLHCFWLLPQTHLLVFLATDLVPYVLLLIVDITDGFQMPATILIL